MPSSARLLASVAPEDGIARLARTDGLTIVLTTHHPHHALDVAHEVLLMLAVDQFLHGPTDDMLTEANLASVYGVAIKRVPFEHNGRHRVGLMPILDGARLDYPRVNPW